MKLSLKPIRASRAPGFQGHYGGSQLVLTLYRMHFFCFQMCNRLPEMMKNGDAGIFPVYYSLNMMTNHLPRITFAYDGFIDGDPLMQMRTHDAISMQAITILLLYV